MKSHPRLFVFLCLCVSRALHAQEVGPDLSVDAADTVFHRNTAGILFERNLNTYNWTGRASMDTSVLGMKVLLREEYTSNIILLEGTSSTPQQRPESNQQRISLLLDQPVASNFSTHAQWASLVYSDNKAVGISNASTHSLLGGITYAPIPGISFGPSVGYRWEKQLDVRDKGVEYLFDARTQRMDVDGYLISGEGHYDEARLDPRSLEGHYARVGVQRTFLGATRDTLELGFRRNRREFYAIADTNIESRIENVFSFTNLLDYEFNTNVIGTLFVNVSNRILDKNFRALQAKILVPGQFDTEIDEFRLEVYFETRYTADNGGTAASTRFYYSERDENHTAKERTASSLEAFRTRSEEEKTKDNVARRTALSGSLELSLSKSDRVMLSGTTSILRYDTPSEFNFEDRDELLVAVTLATSHKISQYFDLAFSLEGNLSHVVYLLNQRSANNNYNRVIRFSPRTVYRPISVLSTTNSFEVLANYTVYDFQQQLVQVRSFSYRQFGWMDSTSVQVTRRVGLDFLTYLKLYERGQLNWSAFTERTENSFSEQTYAVQGRFTPYEEILFAVGLRYFSQSRYGYTTGQKQLESFLKSVGPTCQILWNLSAQSQVGFRGWYEHRSQSGGSRSLANMAMNILFNF